MRNQDGWYYTPGLLYKESSLKVNDLDLHTCAKWWEIVSSLNLAESEHVVRLPMLRDITRIFIATTSDIKFDAFKDFFLKHLEINTGPFEIPVQRSKCPGSEPEDNQALLVALDKLFRSVGWLKSKEARGEIVSQTDKDLIPKEGGLALGLASDTTVAIGIDLPGYPLRHLLNLSRVINEKGEEIDYGEHLKGLQQMYSSRENVIVYDVATVASRLNSKGRKVLVGTGVRVRIHLKQIPPKVVENAFQKNRKKSVNTNVGLPVVDKESPILPYIKSVDIVPLSHYANKQTNGLPSGHIQDYSMSTEEPITIDLSKLSEGEKEKCFEALRVWVIGGTPPNLEALLQFDPEDMMLDRFEPDTLWIV